MPQPRDLTLAMLIHVAFLIAAFFALWGGKRYRRLVEKNTLQSMHLRLIVERLWAKGKLVQPGDGVITVYRRIALLVHQVAWFTGRNGAPESPDNAGDAPDASPLGPRAFRRATGPADSRARDPPSIPESVRA